MASVFDPFRKKQKQWLAVLGVLCMGGFIFGGMDCDFGSDGAARADDYAVTIKGEGMTYRQVEGLLQDHAMATQFTNQLRGGSSEVFLPVSREWAVYTQMLAQKGEELGVAISDDAINSFIDDNNFTRMTQSEIKGLASSYRWPMESLFRALRMELMARQTLALYVPTPDSVVASPAQLWEYYQRLHRRANTQILQIDAKNYLSQVGEPTEEDLQKLFTEFKGRLPDPYSPEPGFTQPTRATIDYIEADYQKFLRQAEAEITEADLQKYYDEHKDTEFKFTRFVPEGPPLVAPPAANDPAPGQEKDDAAAGAAADGDQAGNQTDAAAGGDAAKGDTTGSGGDAGAGNSGSGDAGNGTGNGDAGNGGGQDPWPVSAPFDPAQDGGQTGDSQTGGQNGQSTDENKTTAQDATGQDAGTQNAGDSARGDATRQGGDATQPGAAPEGDNRSIQTIAEQFRIPKRLIDGPNPTYDPFWKVRSRILNKLATEKVTERINAAVAKIRELTDAQAAKVSRYQARQEGNDPNSDAEKAALSARIAKVCEEHGLAYHPRAAQQQDVLAFSELEGLKDVSVFTGGNFRALAEAIFTPSIGLYIVIEGDDADSNKIVAWKTEEQKQFEPKTLDEVRTQVVDAWKLRKARDLAKARAEEIVNGVNDGGKAMDTFATEQIPLLKVEPFTWLKENYDPSLITPQMAAQLGINFAPYSLTSIEKLPRVGYDFMETTFKLADGTAGVASNMPQTSYYVVKVNSFDYVTALGGTAEVDAHRAFLLTNPERYVYLYSMDYQAMMGRFIEQMATTSEVLWADPPEQR